MTNIHTDGRATTPSRPRHCDNPQQVQFPGRGTSGGWRADIMAAERDVTHLFSWTCGNIPVLVQSEHYMLTQIDAGGSVDIAAPMAERRARQRLFDTNPGANYEFILSESALDRLVASVSPAVALDQLDHMLSLVHRYPKVGIRVVLYEAAPYVDPGFTSLSFADPTRDFVYTETPLDRVQVTHGSPDEFADSQDALQYLALSLPETAQMLAMKSFTLRERDTHRLATAPTPKR